MGGVAVGRLAAFDTSTGSMITSWKAKAWAGVRALEVYGDTVYVGGVFSTFNAQPRARLAAVDAATGALRPWAPTAERTVGDQLRRRRRQAVCGRELRLRQRAARHAIAALDPVTGSLLPFPAAAAVPPVTQGCTSVIKDLTTDATTVYAAAEGSGGGCFDGTFAANVNDGSLKWRNACLGATQAIEVLGGYLYKGSHAHNCSSILGGFPEVEDGQSFHLLAQRLSDGLLGPWYPNTNGDPLGPRVFATDGRQLFVGGDFKTVNNKPQQGFTRFELGPPTAPPIRPDAPTVASIEPGKVRVSFPATWDRDDNELNYTLLRDGVTPVKTWTISSTPWSRPTVVDRDEGLVPGASHTYRLQLSDGANTLKSPATPPVTVASAPVSCETLVKTGLPTFYWRLGETSGGIAADATGNGFTGIYRSGTRKGQPGMPSAGSNTAVDFDKGLVTASASRFTNPQTFSTRRGSRRPPARAGRSSASATARPGRAIVSTATST